MKKMIALLGTTLLLSCSSYKLNQVDITSWLAKIETENPEYVAKNMDTGGIRREDIEVYDIQFEDISPIKVVSENEIEVKTTLRFSFKGKYKQGTDVTQFVIFTLNKSTDGNWYLEDFNRKSGGTALDFNTGRCQRSFLKMIRNKYKTEPIKN